MKNLLSPLGNVFLANRTIQAKVHRCKIAKKKSTLDGYCISVDVALFFFNDNIKITGHPNQP